MQPAKKGVRNLLKSVWSGEGSYIYHKNSIWFCCRPEEETTNTPRHTTKCPDNKIFCQGVKSTSTVTDGQVGKSQTQARIIALRTGSYNMLWQVTPVRKCQQGESSLLSGFFILLLEAHDVQGVQWINDGCSKSSKFIRTPPWLRLHCANSLKWLDDTWYMNYSSNPEGGVITLRESRLIA